MLTNENLSNLVNIFYEKDAKKECKNLKCGCQIIFEMNKFLSNCHISHKHFNVEEISEYSTQHSTVPYLKKYLSVAPL